MRGVTARLSGGETLLLCHALQDYLLYFCVDRRIQWWTKDARASVISAVCVCLIRLPTLSVYLTSALCV